jgi:hypothetical protein
MVSMALAVKDIPFDNVVFVQYPNSYGSSNGLNGVLPIKTAADTLFTAIKADQPIALTGTTGVGTVAAPNAPTPTVPPSASANPSASPPATAVQLPSTVHGQTAAQQTCTKGQRAGGH